MEHVATQTEKMVGIATKTIEAAMKEETMGMGGGGSGDSTWPEDTELQEQVRLVRTKMSEIQKLKPQLLKAADMAAGEPTGSAASENLNLLSQEWAAKVSSSANVLRLEL